MQFNFKPLCFTWTLLMTCPKATLKSNAVKASPLFQINPNRNHIRRMLAYVASAVSYIQTHFYEPYQVHEKCYTRPPYTLNHKLA
jgi:hypothetical protein